MLKILCQPDKRVQRNVNNNMQTRTDIRTYGTDRCAPLFASSTDPENLKRYNVGGAKHAGI